MAGTSYQISISADFKDAKGGLKELGVAIKEVETIAGGFAKRAEGLGNRLEAIFGGKLNQKLKNLGSNILLQSDKLAASSSPLSGAQLGSKLGSFRVKLENYGAQQSEIDALLSEFKQANVQAIKNFYEQVSLANREAIADAYKSALQDLDKATEYARKIVHDGKLDSAIHRDTRDVYSGLANFNIDKVELSDLYKITESLREIRLHTAQVIQREIENLERDALAVGRAIKAADITRVESRIGSYREVLGTGEVARLKDLLQSTVSSVAGELQVKSTQGLLDAIQNVVENVTLSSKQLKAQLESFRTQAESLGIQGGVFDDFAEVKQLTARIREVERQELLQFQKDTRKRITDSLREILQKTSVDLQQIHKLSADFKQAGGTSGDFAAKGTQGILSELVKRVADMKLKGQEFTRELERYYENLFKVVGVEGNQLASLVGFVKTNASAVNSNAATMRMNAMRSEIAKIFVSYNRVNEAISKAIMDRMRRDWASVSSTDFNTEFASGLRGQETIVKRGELKQAMEGIWKPFQKQLADLTELKAFLQRNNAASLEAYTSQIGPTLLRNLERQFASVKAALAEQSSGRHASISSAEANSIRIQLEGMLDEVGTDVDRKVAIELSRRMSQIRAQLRQVQAGNAAAMPDIKGVNATLAQAAKEASVKNDAQLQLRLNNTRKLLDDVTQQLAKDDALKRAQALIRSQTRSLGGEAALRAQLVEIRKAAAENAKAIKQYDREMAAALLRNARMVREQARQAAGMGRQRSTSGKGDDPYALHPNIIANYRRQIPMQLTDIVVGLSTGQLPMYVLLQQGGQLKDMFGGIGNAVKEVGKYLLGWKDDMSAAAKAAAVLKRVLATVAIGAIAGMALLMKKAADFNAQIKNTAVELKFRGVELSGDEFRNYAERMSQSLGIARTNAAEIFKQIAIDAKLPKESFDSLVEGLEDISTALGNGWDTKGLQETVKLLGESFKDKDSFLEFASNYAVFNKEQYESIKNLYDQGDAAKATALAMQTLAKNTQGAAQEAMTPFQETVKTAKEELLKQLQVVGDGLPWQTFMDNISSTAQLLANLVGIVARATAAIAGFIGMVGNSVVGVAFKGYSLIQGGKAWAAESDYNKAKEDLARAESRKASAEQLAHLRESLRIHETNYLQLKENAEAASEVGTNLLLTGAQSREMFMSAVGLADDLAEKAKEAAKATGKAASVKPSDLQTFANPKGDKPNKRGSGSRGGKSQMEKEAEGAEKYILKLKEAWENYRQLTKLEQLSFDLENGKVKMTQQQIAVATELAKAIDERTRKQAEELRIMERKRMEAQKMTEVQNKIQEYALQAARMQRADSVVDYYQQMVEYDNQLAQRIRDLNFARDKEVREYYLGGKSNQIADLNAYYDYQINLERQKAEELKKLWDEYYREQIRLGTSWLTGFEKGLDQVAFKVKDLSSEVASAVESWADQMGDALANFVRTGKFDFRSLADSILNDIARMAANDFIRNLIGGFKYGFGTPIADSGHKEVQDRVAQFKSINGVQMVHVVNMPSSGDLGGAISSAFGSSAGGFTLSNPTSIIGNSNRPLMDFSSATQIGKEAAQGIVTATTPTIQTAANSCFGGVEDGLGGLLSRITSGIGNIFSGFGGGGGGIGGFFGSLFSGIGSFISRIFGFSSGGYTGPGGKYTPAGIVHAGEYVINAAATRRLGLDFLNHLNGYANGGYVSPTPPAVNHDYSKDAGSGLEVNIYNNSNNDVRTQRNASGGLDIFIEQAVNAVAGNIAAGGAVASALQSTYALNRGNGLQRSGY